VTLSTHAPRRHTADTTRPRRTCKAVAANRRRAAADALTALAAAQARRPTVAAEARAVAAAQRLGAPAPARDGVAERRAASRRARADDAIVTQWLLEQVPRRGARAGA
jgi:hypothetical protein